MKFFVGQLIAEHNVYKDTFEELVWFNADLIKFIYRNEYGEGKHKVRLTTGEALISDLDASPSI